MLSILMYANNNCGSLAMLIVLHIVELEMKTWHQTYSGRNFFKNSFFLSLTEECIYESLHDYVFGYQRVKNTPVFLLLQ